MSKDYVFVRLGVGVSEPLWLFGSGHTYLLLIVMQFKTILK